MTDSDKQRRNLGRGLNALLGDDEDAPGDKPELQRGVRTIPVESIEPSRVQPRRIFDKTELEALTQSVREKGILQPILIRRHPDHPDRYELIAGERRWLAAQAAKLHEIPAILRELNDADALEIAIIENVQRQDLTPVEEAEAYRRLMEEFSHTQEALSQIVGKSRSHVANTLRLLSLPDSVKSLIDEGQLTAGHARALVTADDPEALAKEIVSSGMTVRDVERNAKRARKSPTGAASGPDDKGADTLALEKELANLLGLKVEIRNRGESGALVIKYQTLEQLDDVLQRLSRGSM